MIKESVTSRSSNENNWFKLWHEIRSLWEGKISRRHLIRCSTFVFSLFMWYFFGMAINGSKEIGDTIKCYVASITHIPHRNLQPASSGSNTRANYEAKCTQRSHTTVLATLIRWKTILISEAFEIIRNHGLKLWTKVNE